MKKRFKRVYIEITNVCNLSCSFCTRTKREKRMISPEEFEHIVKKIDNYTDYIYLHVKGEPLIHPNLKEILDIADKYHKKVTITTNGTLLKEKEDILLESSCIRQLNLSLHSENNKENYLEEIFSSCQKLSEKMNVVYRFWTLHKGVLDEKSTNIVKKIESEYNLSPDIVDKIYKEENIKIKENIYISKDNEFIWPGVDNPYYEVCGYCHALKDQIAILVDGTVIPCCLDGEGVINLGNILESSMEEILNSERVKKMIDGFRNRSVSEELCKHCSFKEKFDKNEGNRL